MSTSNDELRSPASHRSPKTLQTEFQAILDQRATQEPNLNPKQAAAEQAKQQQILTAAATYTVESIVKGLADLQLDCMEILNDLSTQLSAEVAKLDELDRALELENQHLQILQQVRTVAEMLNWQTQEHQSALQTLENQSAQRQQTLEQTSQHHRQTWAKEQAEFEQQTQEKTAQRQAERAREAADYAYEHDRTQTIDENEFQAKQRTQEQELSAQNQQKVADWEARERALAAVEPLLLDYQQQVAQFTAELEAALQTARTEAIATIERDAQVQCALLTKEWDATEQTHTVRVQGLQNTIDSQAQHIEQRQRQLDETLQQSQALTLKAFDQPQPNRRATS
jgi:hypothetical protein